MAWSWNFAEELRVWGPDAPPVALTLSEAERYCRRLATGHYENFPVVSWVLPRDLHPHFNSVYAFCRWADDLGDEVGDPQRSLALLKWWRSELTDCFHGRTRHPVFVALHQTIKAYDLPIQPFEDLISAFEQDQTVTEYETFSQLLNYCERSANPVGRIVLMLFRKRGDEQFAWSDSICTGLQLANFWQDVSRDLDIGRIYLPAEDRDRFGVTRDDLFARRSTSGFLDLMRFEVERTRPFLKPWRNRSTPPMGDFPIRLQVKVELFARGGLAILDGIEAVDFRVLETRPVVSKSDFAWLIAGCVVRGLRRSLWASRG